MSREEREIYRNELAKRQQVIKDAKLPVIVLLEGWGASGKGSVLASMVSYMDPRFFKAHNMDVFTEEEKRKPFLYRHALRIPLKGQFAFYDGAWMADVTSSYLHGDIDEKEYEKRIESIINFERQLRDNGYLVIKFFLQVDEKTQKERQKALLAHKDTAWKVSEQDLWQNNNYKPCHRLYKSVLTCPRSSACLSQINH